MPQDYLVKGQIMPRRLVRVIRHAIERKRLEKALEKSEERLALALQATQEGVWDWNLQTDAVFYSPRWKQMLGYTEREIEPHVRAWRRLLHPDDKARALEAAAAGRRVASGSMESSVACGTRTAITWASSRGVFPCGARWAAPSCGSWGPTSI